MAKLVFCADVHVGNHPICGGPITSGINQRAEETLDVLAAARMRATALHAPLIVLGDLFDSTKPLPQLVAATQFALATPAIYDNAPTNATILVMGNHDRNSAEQGDHALGPLLEQIVICESRILNSLGTDQKQCVLVLPFRAEPASQWMPEEIVRLAAKARAKGCNPLAVLAHVGIHDAAMRAALPWCADSADAISLELLSQALKDASIPQFLAGNWHSFASWGLGHAQVTQVGALVPTGWDNPGIDPYGSILILDTDTGALTREVLPGPRFVTVTSEDELATQVKQARQLGCSLRVRWKTIPQGVPYAQEMLASYPDLLAAEVHLDRKAAEHSARQAAAAATSTSTIADALQTYVARLPLPPVTVLGEEEFRRRILESSAALLRGSR